MGVNGIGSRMYADDFGLRTLIQLLRGPEL